MPEDFTDWWARVLDEWGGRGIPWGQGRPPESPGSVPSITRKR